MRIPRRDKFARAARYLVGHTGVPNITYDTGTGLITIPGVGTVLLFTRRHASDFMTAALHIPEGGINAVARYDGAIGSVDSAVVAVPLRTYARLLECWVNSEGRQDVSSVRER